MQSFPWIVALLALVLLAMGLAAWSIGVRTPTKRMPLPTDWALSARPVFTIVERRVYRLLREALPHHIVLLKLPLVRFCQPDDPAQLHFWYALLGANHLTFAICSANGRVLAGIDLDTDHRNSRRVLQIKQSVLEVCRVRYLRCASDNLPTVAELQLLVPGSHVPARELHVARDTLSNTVATRRAERATRWPDSALFQDSFFAADSRLDGFGHSEFSGLPSPDAAGVASGPDASAKAPYRSSDSAGDDLGGIVVDAPTVSASPSHPRH